MTDELGAAEARREEAQYLLTNVEKLSIDEISFNTLGEEGFLPSAFISIIQYVCIHNYVL